MHWYLTQPTLQGTDPAWRAEVSTPNLSFMLLQPMPDLMLLIHTVQYNSQCLLDDPIEQMLL